MTLRGRLSGWDNRVLGRSALAEQGRPGPSMLLSLGLLVFGLAIALAGAAGSWHSLGPTLFTSSTVTLPATFERHLGAGDYEVFQRTGTRSGAGFGMNEEAPVTIGPSDVVVIGPDGQPIQVSPDSGVTETLTRHRATYTGTVWFHAPRAGTYRISIRANGGFGEATVTRTLGDTFRQAVGWLLMVLVGGLVALTGIVLLIVGSSRRSRQIRPGWYADPGGTGRLRWWDGNAWTAYLS